MLLFLVLCGSAFLVNNSEGKRKNDLEIVVEHKPENCNRKARIGDTVAVHYTGALENGRVFDSSLVQGREPIQFELGKNRVIKGWEEGIKGMCVGEKRKLIIPPHLGYGKQGVSNVIPPESYLIFTTELMDIKTKPFLDLRSLFQVITWPAIGLVLAYYLYQRFKEQSKNQDKKSKDRKDHKKGKRK
ncbi:FK506-binding protein 2 [Exaiptasia diaphana]|uniref:peptidylprolyl isomerase n=1 Tax=Exaiptasia diaphana TaxID=2652724 RepID=A0A913WX51_EXADI|nr:FK506-binding protein 2 [Exaiptasia diaphana]KXJ27663.1 FK506-binding protein 2 [Exaiptasia diaphana]